MKMVKLKDQILILAIVLLASCGDDKLQKVRTNNIIVSGKLTDSSREKLIKALSDIVASNSSADDKTIHGRFIKQDIYKSDSFYITIKTKNDSLIRLINAMPLDEKEISKMKKDGENITVTYNSSTKAIKFLSLDFEPRK